MMLNGGYKCLLKNAENILTAEFFYQVLPGFQVHDHEVLTVKLDNFALTNAS